MICPDECAACHGTPVGIGRVGTNDRARLIPADDTLYAIARELVRTVTNKVTTDWALRENVRVHLRVPIRIIRNYGYPRDRQEWSHADRPWAGLLD